MTLLEKYEKFWEKGKAFLQDQKKKNQLIYFSNVLEGGYIEKINYEI